MAEITVAMVQMNSSVVSLLSLSPLSKQCSRLSCGLMANQSELCCSNQVEIQTNIESCLSAFSLYLYLFLYLINRIINNNYHSIDRIGRIRLVLIVVTTDNVVCFSSVSISVSFKLLSCLFLLLFLFFPIANAINKSWLLHNLRLFSFLSMYETFSWK